VITLETDRLSMRAFRETDLDDYARICADRQVMRYIGNGLPLSREDSWRSLALILGHWRLRGYGLWAVEEKRTQRLIGRIGLFNPEGWPGLEVGWLLDRARWRQGFATEGGRAVLDFAFSQLGAEQVISVIQPANTASIRVAEKLGERYQRSLELDGIEVDIYGVSRPVR
jgi:RimJ/RimL family protein N-acetyltransferase